MRQHADTKACNRRQEACEALVLFRARNERAATRVEGHAEHAECGVRVDDAELEQHAQQQAAP